LLGTILQAQSYEIEKLHDNINTKRYHEISPVISKDGQSIYFTREAFPIFNRTLVEQGQDLSQHYSPAAYLEKLADIYSSISKSTVHDPVNSSFNQDIWFATSKKGEFDQVSHPKTPINNAFPNSVCALINDGQTVFLINQFPETGGVLPGFSISHQTPTGAWTIPEAIQIDELETIDPAVGMTASEDGEVLILAAQRREGYGDHDLYVCFRLGPKHWSQPLHLGPAVNSPYRETTPSLSRDGKTLFFSSNRRSSMGGSDLFMVYRLDDTWKNWTAPKRFVSPINTVADESQPFFVPATGHLYFTSKRAGSSDIYRVRIAPPFADQVTVVGNVLNAEKKTLQRATVLLRSPSSGIYQDTYIAEDGVFTLKVPKGQSFQLLARKQGFQSQRKTISFKSSYVYFKNQHIDLALKPLTAGTKIDLNTIYFHRSTPIIKEQSLPELSYLSELLIDNQSLVISIEGHTDNLGGRNELQYLSEKRAEVIKSYLVQQKGIAAQRIQTIGYGPDRPLNDNANEQLR
ncbi:MAG: OmpA family protein, partial [Bacteroidota bacterium]